MVDRADLAPIIDGNLAAKHVSTDVSETVMKTTQDKEKVNELQAGKIQQMNKLAENDHDISSIIILGAGLLDFLRARTQMSLIRTLEAQANSPVDFAGTLLGISDQ